MLISLSVGDKMEEIQEVQEDLDMVDVAEQDLIPGLPNDLAIQCLARVPRAHINASCEHVSQAWMKVLRSNQFYDTRKDLGVFDDWPFVLLQGRESGRIWRALDPVSLTWHALPEAPMDDAFHMGDKECFAAGRKLLVVGIEPRALPPKYEVETNQLIWCFDVDTYQWSIAPTMNSMRCLFASATLGHYGYVAGGTVYGTRGRVSTFAERFNSLTNQWEQLPNMLYPRKMCSGFIMDGRFYVIGGSDAPSTQHSHGEFYDPVTNQWTLVQNFWPTAPLRIGQNSPAPPLVAVLANQLYALDAASNELKHHNKVTGVWTALTRVPGRAHHETGWGLAFKAVGHELWVIGGRAPNVQPVGDIQAFKPDPFGGDHTPWRQVVQTYNGDGFCLNCAVMKI